jgi:serine/threonine protein kinase/tetratricopeptide (TPR) repeat protein
MRPGVTIADRFEVEHVAGTGGMGTVYRARDRVTGLPVALKVLREDAGAMDRFAREAEVLAELRHPGIVRYVAHGTTRSGEPYLAMDWLDGQDLADRLAHTGLTVADSVKLVIRASEALSAAHARGIVHRDIKPSNLFLPSDDVEQVKVLDFGVVRLQHATRSPTRTGTTVGTPGYMAPEQARGERLIDARADVFSLGCVLFECLTGRPAFSGEHVMALLAKILIAEAPRVREMRADIPAALDALVASMLAKEPEHRPQDARAIVRELTALGDLSGIKAAAHSTSPPGLTTSEQRLVCVVLAAPPRDDAMQVSMEATLTPAQLTGSHAVARLAVESLGAHFEGLADGSMIVTTPGRGTAMDQAVLAARCAIALRDALPTATVALATGRGDVSRRLPVGEVIERAARMFRSRRTPDGIVRVDDVTAGLLASRFEVEHGEHGLTLLAERPQLETVRTLLGKPTPCVGRDRELAALDGVFQQVREEGVARVALVTAPAGMGKSRVRYELLHKLKDRGDDVEVWMARGDPMSAGSPFGMLAQALRRMAGILDGEPFETRRRKLRARVARNVAKDDVPRVADFLGEMLGVPHPDEESVQLRAARQDAMLMGDQMRRAWEDFLVAECTRGPVLLVLEDLHWGDLPTVQLVDGALRRAHELPFMVLALARPEVHDLFPRLWAERGVLETQLPELTRRAAEKLAQRMLGEEIDAGTITRIVERAAGNAFYLEELIRAVAEGGKDALPETVLAMTETRLERLAPEARLVLRAASVFGQTFWRGAVRALVGRDARSSLDDWLSLLVEREVVTRRHQGKFRSEEEFVFRHALVRDAAYATLTAADRALGHRLAGGWLEQAGESEAIVLAEHFERGGETGRAVGWYRRAAEQALGGNDLVASIARARRGIACGAEGESKATLHHVQAEAHRWRGENAEAQACAAEAMRTFPCGSPEWYRSLEEFIIVSGKRADYDALLPAVRDLARLGEEGDVSSAQANAFASAGLQLVNAGRYADADALFAWLDRRAAPITEHDPAVAAKVHRAWASRILSSGDIARYRVLKERALRDSERAGDLRSACDHRAGVAYGYMLLGAYAESEQQFRACLAEAGQLGLQTVTAMMKNNLGLVLARRGKVDEARAVEGEALGAYLAQGDLRMGSACRSYLATIAMLAGDLAIAEREAREAVVMCEKIPPSLAEALAALASVLLAQNGRDAEALEIASRAMAILTELGMVDEGDAAIRLVHAEALFACGRREEARAAIAVACDELRARAEKIGDERWRRSFLEQVPENARSFAKEREWLHSTNFETIRM